MRTYRSLLFIPGLLLALLLAACGQAPAAAPPPTAELATATSAPVATAAPAAAATSAPPPAAAGITFTDDLGRTVELAATPQRIVSIAPSVTEMLFAIGAGDQVVGVTEFCNFPPEAQEREKIGGFSVRSISVEAIVGLEPDLVIAGTADQAPISEALEPLGVNIVVLAPLSFADVYANISALGEITGNADQAQQVADEMQERVDAVVAVVAEIPADERPRVFYEVFGEPLITAGPDTFIGEMIDLAGATNIFADVNEDYPQISAEEVVARDPQVILAPDSHQPAPTPELLAQRPGWAEISAVQNERVYQMDGDMVSRPGPRLADALEAMVAALYPEVFSQ